RFREQKFLVLPVLIDDVDLPDLEDGVIEQIQLREIQHIKVKDPQDACAQIVAVIKKFYDGYHSLTPREIREKEIENFLCKAGVTTAILETALQSLEGWPKQLENSPDRPFQSFAKTLLKVDY